MDKNTQLILAVILGVVGFIVLLVVLFMAFRWAMGGLLRLISGGRLGSRGKQIHDAALEPAEAMVVLRLIESQPDAVYEILAPHVASEEELNFVLMRMKAKLGTQASSQPRRTWFQR